MVILLTTLTTHDYIPAAHEEFDGWQENFMTELAADLGTFSLSALDADYIALGTEQGTWVTKWAAGKKANPNRSHPDTVAMQEERKVYEPMLRQYTQEHLAKNHLVTNYYKARLRITIFDLVRTRAAAPGAHTPLGIVKEVKHLVHVIQIVDPEADNSEKLPEGISHVRVFRYIGTQATPGPDVKFEFIGDCSTGKFLSHFTLADVTKTAHYFFVYVNTRHEAGSDSEIVSETII